METVKKYLLNESKASKALGSVIKQWNSEQMKLAKKFEMTLKTAVAKIDDVEGLEDFRDMELNRLPITDELKYAIADVVEKRIDDLWEEMVASEKAST